MQVIYRGIKGPGWNQTLYMARLAAELFGTELFYIPPGTAPGKMAKLGALLPRGRKGEAALIIGNEPRDLESLLLFDGWRKRFGQIFGYTMNSFETGDIPRLIKPARLFDKFYVTTEEEAQDWVDITGIAAGYLSWGADVLRLGSGGAARDLDLLRIGRQPPEWDKDKITRSALASRGMIFQGRTPMIDDPAESQKALAAVYARSKFTLAFNTRVNPMHYTHKTKQYMTARWAESLAGGTIVAGAVPVMPSIQRLLWPGGLLELETIEREPGLAIIEEAVRAWQPKQAMENYRMALQRLDWRWRFAQIAKDAGENPPKLAAELQLLAAKLNDAQLSQ